MKASCLPTVVLASDRCPPRRIGNRKLALMPSAFRASHTTDKHLVMRKPRHAYHPLVLFLSLLNVSEGQRAIVSLASKLQNRFFSRTGEEETLQSSDSSSGEAMFSAEEIGIMYISWTVCIGIAVLGILSFRGGRKQHKEAALQDGESCPNHPEKLWLEDWGGRGGLGMVL